MSSAMNEFDVRAHLGTAMEKLLAYAAGQPSRCEAALAEFLGDGDCLDESQSQGFFAFLCQGHEDATGERLIDRFLRESGANLPAAERRALEVLAAAWFSLFEVQSVQSGEQLRVRDLFTDSILRVEGDGVAAEVSRFDLLLGWILPVGRTRLLGVGTLVPRIHRDPVIRVLEDAAAGRRPVPELQARLRRAAGLAHAALGESYRNFRPRLVTTEGDDVLFCSAHYRLADPERVCRVFERDPRLDARTADRFLWIERKGHEAADGGAEQARLGTIRVTGRNLVLETNSRDRLERGKALLAEIVGRDVEHAMDRLQDPWQAIAEEAESHAQRRDPAEARRIASEARLRVEAWLDEKVPALGDRTPREAARTRKWRPRLVEMLKDHENHFARLAGDGIVDLGPIYDELGLGRA